MEFSIAVTEEPWKTPLNIYQRRVYAARRAIIAVDNYTSLSFTDKPAVDKERALRWMKAWLAFAVSRER